jgi:hypothetical protein
MAVGADRQQCLLENNMMTNKKWRPTTALELGSTQTEVAYCPPPATSAMQAWSQVVSPSMVYLLLPSVTTWNNVNAIMRSANG